MRRQDPRGLGLEVGEFIRPRASADAKRARSLLFHEAINVDHATAKLAGHENQIFALVARSHVRLKELDAVVIKFDSSRQDQFAISGSARMAERHQRLSLEIEKLDGLRGGVHDISQARAVHRHALGPGEQSRPDALLSDRLQMLPLQIINLHRARARVRHQQSPALLVNREVGG
jgi:hypothetical protein